jgi:hypothetical protein
MRRSALALALIALAATLPASTAHAQATPGKEHAKRLFDEGAELEKKSDYAGALAKYKEAEQITVTAGLRFHKGYCLEMTGKLAAALDEYEAAEKMARDQNKQDVRAAVSARLDPLRARVPQISIRLTAPVKDAEVQLDGVVVATPLLDGKGFRVDPGDHKVTGRAPGHRSFAREVHVPEAVTTTVDVALDPEPGAGDPPIAGAARAGSAPPTSNALTPPPREERASRSVVLPIVTTAGAVALAATGIAMFVVAGGAQSDAERDCPTKITCDSERSKVRTFDALALAGFASAAGLGVLSVVLWTRSAGSAGASTPATRVVAGPTGAIVAGSF